MIWDDPYTQQLVKQIESLIAADKYQKAMDICNEMLDKNPDDGKALELVRRIEERVSSENEKKIDQSMQDLEPLWREKKYSELVQKLHALKQFSPEYKPLLNAVIKAESKYRDALQLSSKGKMIKIKSDFDQLFKESKLDEVMQLIQSLEADVYQEDTVRAHVKIMREKLVDTHLKTRKDLIYGDKFDDTLSFLDRISSLSPSHKKLAVVIRDVKARRAEQAGSERAETSFSSLESIRTLLKLGKYEEASNAARELEIFNPSSKEVKNLRAEADKRFEEQLNAETLKQMETYQKANKEGFDKNDGSFKKLI